MDVFLHSQDQERCAIRKTTQSTLPSFWDFLKIAKYVGQQVVRHITYDIWEFNVSHTTHSTIVVVCVIVVTYLQ